MTEKKTNGTIPPEPSNVREAIVAVMQNIGYVQKVKAAGLNYSYASEADLIAALRPHMVAVGLSVSAKSMQTILDQEVTSKGGTAGRRVVIGYVWTFNHAPSDTSFDVVSYGEGIDFGDKACNKAMTAALKYALRQTFLIETGDDPDQVPSTELESVPTKQDARDWTATAPGLAKALKEAGVVPEDAAAKHVLAFLNLSPFGPGVTNREILSWGRMYRTIRDDGEDDAKVAADQATKQYFEILAEQA